MILANIWSSLAEYTEHHQMANIWKDATKTVKQTWNAYQGDIASQMAM